MKCWLYKTIPLLQSANAFGGSLEQPAQGGKNWLVE